MTDDATRIALNFWMQIQPRLGLVRARDRDGLIVAGIAGMFRQYEERIAESVTETAAQGSHCAECGPKARWASAPVIEFRFEVENNDGSPVNGATAKAVLEDIRASTDHHGLCLNGGFRPLRTNPDQKGGE